ncbi:hypothetical protein [Methanococcus maripaludis]|uniref:Uncharacterized protein n=1 Tax=Methanococcus maripaludis TaxID=39152 RepID=A0A7J9PCQ2_METMI|nr:hypothetical protein [Methanococcus maripaludis]MBA2861033.1 hypothetical protein [Methanococcus maripaludis]MBA2868942.1 hypothetical protein [Methanococcus maripaludis]
MVKVKLRKLSKTSVGISLSRSDVEYLDIDYDKIFDEPTVVEKKYVDFEGKKGVFITAVEKK